MVGVEEPYLQVQVDAVRGIQLLDRAHEIVLCLRVLRVAGRGVDVPERDDVLRQRDGVDRAGVVVDGARHITVGSRDASDARERVHVAREDRERLLIVAARVVDSTRREVEVGDLRVRPCRMLRRSVAIRALDRLLPALLAVVEVAPRLKQQRASSERREVGREIDRFVVRVRCVSVASESHVRVAEHAVAVCLLRLLRDRRLRQR